jgi:glycosyltransferase involved in cell wall biosynthesis
MELITALIMTKNEEINIADCVANVAWCSHIVIYDSFSTDRTVEIARTLGCEVVQRKFDDWSTHQNWILETYPFKTPWVLHVDADERISDSLRGEITGALQGNDRLSAFRMRRKDFWQGTWLRRCTLYPTWLVRVYRPQFIRFERLVNPVPRVNGEIGELAGHIDHFPFSKGVVHWLERHNSYSTFEAREYEKPEFSLRDIFKGDPNKRRASLKGLFATLPARPLVKFLLLYVLRRGFLDGAMGFHYALLQSFYEYMISLKLREKTWNVDR